MATPSAVLLTGRFYISKKKQKVTLTEKYLSWECESSSECSGSYHRVPLSHVIAALPCDCPSRGRQCRYCKGLQPPNCPAPLSLRVHYAAPVSQHRWRLRSVRLRPLESGGISLQDWVLHLSQLLDLQGYRRPRKLLVFINPYGGKKKAPDIYKKVYPLFRLASIQLDERVTQRANHARDLLLDMDLSGYDGVVGVGGDGMFSELLNGLVVRAQQDAGVNMDNPYAPLSPPSLSLGVVPAGSTDALACSVTGVNDPVSSALIIIMGQRVKVDVTSIHHNGKLIRYNSSFLGYGYFGDLMAESEKFRWMGPKRYDWSGVKTILGNRVYSGEIRLLKTQLPHNWLQDRCLSNCGVCTQAAGDKGSDDMSWVTVRGQFMAVNVATMSCRCGISREGIAPSAHLGDGCADVILVNQCSRWDFLRYLLRISLHNSSPNELEFVDVHRVREFQFTPLVEKPGQESVWNCDGEVLSQPSIRARVHCQLVQVFGSGIEERTVTGCCPGFLK